MDDVLRRPGRPSSWWLVHRSGRRWRGRSLKLARDTLPGAIVSEIATPARAGPCSDRELDRILSPLPLKLSRRRLGPSRNWPRRLSSTTCRGCSVRRATFRKRRLTEPVLQQDAAIDLARRRSTASDWVEHGRRHLPPKVDEAGRNHRRAGIHFRRGPRNHRLGRHGPRP